MSNIAIRLKGVCKKYQIGQSGGARYRYKTLREAIGNVVLRGLRRAPDSLPGLDVRQAIYALDNVSFELQVGEVVGVIGRNGAGKSTLLKILSRITEPTDGTIDIFGRVGSLLEVGTGFHPELTGRENVYLNGAILGMRRREIDFSFDAIVSFSEVEKFIDTPVKHYSSGMYLRLAFAVAAHLQTEILIVDEVLAVGDASFTNKCLRKIEDVSRQGRTVIFVSHNMQAINRLCERVIWLQDGMVRADGAASTVVSDYLASVLDSGQAELVWPDPTLAPQTEIGRLRVARVKRGDGTLTNVFDVRESFIIEMEFELFKSGYEVLPHVNFVNEEGAIIFTSLDNDMQWRGKARPAGFYKSSVIVAGDLFLDGRILIEPCAVTLAPLRPVFSIQKFLAVQMVDAMKGDSARGSFTGHLRGMMNPLLHWHTVVEESSNI